MVWTGLEFARGHLLTGFTMASLAHTQYRWITLIQLSDLGGCYLVGCLMMFVSACLAQAYSFLPSGDKEDEGASSSRIHTPVLRLRNLLGITRTRIVGVAGFWRVRIRIGPVILAGLVLGAALGYGQWRLVTHQPPAVEPLRIALIQGSIDIVLNPPPGTTEKMHQQYWELSQEAVRRFGKVDLIIWPETVFAGFLIGFSPDATPPADWQGSRDSYLERLAALERQSRYRLWQSARLLGSSMLVGITRVHFTGDKSLYYNSAAFVPLVSAGANPLAPDAGGRPEPVTRNESRLLTRSEVNIESHVIFSTPSGAEASEAFAGAETPHGPGLGPLNSASKHDSPGVDSSVIRPVGSLEPDLYPIEVYDKMHLVMFGEYVPFADQLEWLIRLTPLSTLQVATQPGRAAKSFSLRHLKFSPNICFETIIPHLIHRQVLELKRAGSEPDVLVNLTNDGWFWGSSELDLHLICGIFRAVECRKVMLIAANTGFSAWIDGSGRVLAQGLRRACDVLLAEVVPDGRISPYLLYGDWPAGVCLVGTVFLAAYGALARQINGVKKSQDQKLIGENQELRRKSK